MGPISSCRPPKVACPHYTDVEVEGQTGPVPPRPPSEMLAARGPEAGVAKLPLGLWGTLPLSRMVCSPCPQGLGDKAGGSSVTFPPPSCLLAAQRAD